VQHPLQVTAHRNSGPSGATLSAYTIQPLQSDLYLTLIALMSVTHFAKIPELVIDNATQQPVEPALNKPSLACDKLSTKKWRNFL
jgi:hypothetical protein